MSFLMARLALLAAALLIPSLAGGEPWPEKSQGYKIRWQNNGGGNAAGLCLPTEALSMRTCGDWSANQFRIQHWVPEGFWLDELHCAIGGFPTGGRDPSDAVAFQLQYHHVDKVTLTQGQTTPNLVVDSGATLGDWVQIKGGEGMPPGGGYVTVIYSTPVDSATTLSGGIYVCNAFFVR